jgi:(1->4)-alpha-D-glucan 1-alpha-D-glucosylmutase
MPDFYQGTDLWDLNLVDPDNRRPVDFELRGTFLRDIMHRCEEDLLALIAELLASKEDGRAKLFLIHRALKARQLKPELFSEGAYLPIKVMGKHRRRVISFGRQLGEDFALAVVPRFLTGLVKEDESPLGGRVWEDTCLVLPRSCHGPWKNWITGQALALENSLMVGEVFEHFPASLLINGISLSSSRQ